MVGEDPDSTEAVDPRISFSHQSVWKRVAIVTAGPIFNLLFAFVAFTLVLAIYGQRVPSDIAKVGGVMSGMPAAQKRGCRSAMSSPRSTGNRSRRWDELSNAIRASEGRAVTMTVQRSGEALNIEITPQAKEARAIYGEVIGQAYVIGIERGFEETRASVRSRPSARERSRRSGGCRRSS